MALKVAIVTPETEALNIECDEVIAPGITGDVGLLPGHVPLITALRPGVLSVFAEGRASHFAVSSGFAEIEQDVVTVLTSSCEARDAIDVDHAKNALKEAEKALADMAETDPKFPEHNRVRQRAQARIDTVSR